MQQPGRHGEHGGIFANTWCIQNLIDPTASSKDIRGHLCQFLCSIEQVSAQGLNVLCSQGATMDIPSAPFSEKGTLTLVCISVSVIATPGGSVSLRSLFDDPDQHLIGKMGSQLCTSPLFRYGFSLHELCDAFASLDLVFSARAYNAMDDEPFAASPPHDRISRMVMSKQEWTCQYKLSQTQEAFRSHTSGRKRPREAMFGGRDTREVAESAKRRKRSPSEKTKEHSGSLMKR